MQGYLKILVIILVIILVSLIVIGKNSRENYKNWSDGIYAIRPPYDMARYYNPSKMASYRIYKYNFLNDWITG